MEIKAYLKPQCGWSMGVRAIMEKHNLKYEDLDIITTLRFTLKWSRNQANPCRRVLRSKA